MDKFTTKGDFDKGELEVFVYGKNVAKIQTDELNQNHKDFKPELCREMTDVFRKIYETTRDGVKKELLGSIDKIIQES